MTAASSTRSTYEKASLMEPHKAHTHKNTYGACVSYRSTTEKYTSFLSHFYIFAILPCLHFAVRSPSSPSFIIISRSVFYSCVAMLPSLPPLHRLIARKKNTHTHSTRARCEWILFLKNKWLVMCVSSFFVSCRFLIKAKIIVNDLLA